MVFPMRYRADIGGSMDFLHFFLKKQSTSNKTRSFLLNSSLGLQILQGHHGRRHLSNDRRKDPGRSCKDIESGPKNHPLYPLFWTITGVSLSYGSPGLSENGVPLTSIVYHHFPRETCHFGPLFSDKPNMDFVGCPFTPPSHEKSPIYR